MFSRSIIEDALLPVIASPVAHYTRIGTLRHFIPAGKPSGWASAWATPVQFLNDRMELTLGLEVLRTVATRQPQSARIVQDVIEQLITTDGTLNTDAFQMSFSGNPDELGQWRGYGANGMGCSVVTDALAVWNRADIAGWVIYDTQEQETFAATVLQHLRNETDVDLLNKVLIASASYMKHKGFEPEKEFRLLTFPDIDKVEFRESGDRLVPYVDFLDEKAPLPISKVIIGPGWQLSRLTGSELAQNHIAQGIRRLLSARGLYATGIESSRIPYDPK